MTTPSILDKLQMQTRHFKNLRIFTSCESLGANAEYIRKGLVYSMWEKNLIHCLAQENIKEVFIMMTVNALSLFNLVDFLYRLDQLKKQTQKGKLKISINILRKPSFQSLLILPQDYRDQVAKTLSDFMTFAERQQDLYSRYELEQLHRLLKFLKEEKLSTYSKNTYEDLVADFKNFYEQYDQRFGLDLKKIIPAEIKDWLGKLAFHTTNKA